MLTIWTVTSLGSYLKPPSSPLPLYLHDLATFVKLPKNPRHPLVFCQMLPSLTGG